MHHHNAQPGINAERVARSLGGASRVGSGWMCRCPAHDDRTPSLHISDRDGGGLLAKCFAGCEQAEVVAALRARGLWEQNNYFFTPQARDRAEVELHRADVKRTDVALDIWKTAAAANRTLVERYLGSRGLYLPLPITIRFHEGLKHSSGSFWPAMVALVRRGVDDQWMAIHRTFLAKDGMSKAPVAPQKMMLGPCRGSAAGRAEQCAHGRRRHRNLPLRHAGDRQSCLGRALNLRAACSRSADRRARRHRALPMVTIPGRQLPATPRNAGAVKVVAFALRGRHKETTSMISFWVARPLSRGTRHEQYRRCSPFKECHC
jgi:hypothetical protein